MDVDSNLPQPGTTFVNQFEILSVIGQGRSTTVFRVKHLPSNQTFALKLLCDPTDPLQVARFQLEAQALSTIVDSGIQQLHEFAISEGGRPYMLLDYIDGQSLASIVETSGPISGERCKVIFQQLCQTMDRVHKRGVIHRNLKPSNFLISGLDGQESAKIIDFSMCRHLNSKDSFMTGEITGTPYYMSPEQCLGRPIDVRTDVYSLGCCMYFVLKGHPPFEGESTSATMAMHVSSVPQIDESIPEQFHSLLRQSLEKEPEKRFQSMAQMSHAIKNNSVTSGAKKEKGWWPFGR